MLRVGFEPTTRGLSTRGLCQLGYHSALRHRFPLDYRRQDSNLQLPESESGASCRWATAVQCFSPRRHGEHGGRRTVANPPLRDFPLFSVPSVPPWRTRFSKRRPRDSNPLLRRCRPAPRHSATSSATEAEGFEPSRGLSPPSGIPGGAPRHWGQSFLPNHNDQRMERDSNPQSAVKARPFSKRPPRTNGASPSGHKAFSCRKGTNVGSARATGAAGRRSQARTERAKA